MEKIKSEKKFCIYCMEEHEIDIVRMLDIETFKEEEITFSAIYQYCSIEDEFTETEEMIRSNCLSMKDAYRKKMNLLTSKEIIEIREKYSMSQEDLAKVLGWEKNTITRYEDYEVQDRSNDNILRNLKGNSKQFLEMLKGFRK